MNGYISPGWQWVQYIGLTHAPFPNKILCGEKNA